MSVILEFSIDDDAFRLGQVLSRKPDYMHLELERIVPTGNMIMPFVWATGSDHGTFEEMVRSHPAVDDLRVLDSIGESGLYRITWNGQPTDLVEAIANADGIVLEATGNEKWVFRLRFPDHDKLSQFHNYIIENGISIHIERTYTLTEETERGHRFGLSHEQREALVLALRKGYFETPSEVSLDDLAAELDITRQAVSNRIRRGNEKVLRSVLLTSAADFD
ncbi:MAG: bacterio-opsin activator domain-containing protein [Halodesulfurarchaeum sp.]